MEVFKTFKGYAPLRRAIAQIVGRNENVMETWHKFEALKDPLNMVCGYDQSDNNMREVDVLMMESAFETKTGQTCISFKDVDGECENGMDRFIHLNIGSDGKATQIACSLSSETEQLFHVQGLTPTETFGIDDKTQLWEGSKKRLQKFLKDRKKADGYKEQRGKQRQNTALVSTTKEVTFRPRSAGQTPNPKRQKGDDDGGDEDSDDAAPRDDTAPRSDIAEPTELFPDATRTSSPSPDLHQSLFDEHGNINESTTTRLIDGLMPKYKKKEELTLGEKRLLGCLAQIDMAATKRGEDSIPSITDIPSFPHVKKFTLVRQPIQYLHDTDPNPRTTRRHIKIAQLWLGLLVGASFTLAFVIDKVTGLGDVAKRQVSKAAGCCCSPEETVMFQTYCNLNGEQLKRIKRFTLWKWGWRMFSSWGSVAKVKEDYFDSNCKTAQSKTVIMQRPVKQTRNGENVMKYSCFSQVIIVDTLKKEFNVDLQVYFNGVIIGPHCMILAENAENIQQRLHDEMVKKVKEPSLREAMEKYREKMVAIYKVWYELCKTMMSTKEQDDAAIEKFEDNIKELKRQIHNLIVVDPPLSGDKNPLQLPTKLKWFTLLSDVLVNTLKLWRCIGDVAEESIESFHPRRNKMSKRYCQVRGKRRNELIMKALQFESASWIWEGIQDMLKATKSKRAKVVRKQQPTTVEAPQEDDDEEEEQQEEEELLDWELRMNECPSLRVQDDFEHEDEALRSAYMKMDTRIHICCGCRMRFIGERALKIHQNERHNIKSEDTDAVDGNVR